MGFGFLPSVIQAPGSSGMSAGYSSAVAALKPDPIFNHVKAGMSVIIKNMDGSWHMADVIHVMGSVKSTKTPLFFQVTYVNNHVTSWVKADLVTHIVPRV